MFFKIKRRTKLTKLQSAYANKVGEDVASIRCVDPSTHSACLHRLTKLCLDCSPPVLSFLYDGSRINEGDAPLTLGMEDNNSIDVMVKRMWMSALLARINSEPVITNLS